MLTPRFCNFLNTSAKRTTALWALIAAAAVLRLWGIQFGLPHREARPDESTVIYMALQAVVNGPEPAHLTYPTFFVYLLAVIYKVFGLFMGGQQGLLMRYAANPDALFLTARILAAAFGVLLVIPVYKTAKLLFGARAAFAAAALAAAVPLLARDSHFGTLDIPAVCFIAWSGWFLTRAYFSGRAADYAWAGLCAGLATGTKYIGVLMFCQLAAVRLALLTRAGANPRALLADKRPLYFSLAFLAAFFVSTPYAFLAPAKMLGGFTFHTKLHGGTGSLWHHLGFGVPHALTLPAAALAAAGLLLAAVKKPRQTLVFGGFALAYALVLIKVHSAFIRYVLPLLPALCIGAGYALSRGTARGKTILPFTLACALTLAAPLYYTMRQNLVLARPDTRATAAADFAAAVPQGASVAVLASNYSTPQLAWNDGYLTARITREAAGPNPLKAKIYASLLEHNRKTGNTGYRRILPTPQETLPETPDFIIIACGIFETRTCPQAKEEFAATHKVWRTIDPGVLPGAVYDTTDAFYLPLNGKTVRPGPTYLFLRKS